MPFYGVQERQFVKIILAPSEKGLLLAGANLFCYEKDFMVSLSEEK